MLDQIRALIVEAIGDGVTVQVKPSNVRKMVVLTDADDDSAVYLDGVLQRVIATNILADVMAEVANGLSVVIVHRRLDYSVPLWGDKLREVIKVPIMAGEPHHNGLALKSEWNAKEGCFEDSIVEPEKEWVPKRNEWVRLPDGTVRQHIGYEIHGTRKYYRFEGTNTSWDSGRLESWKPKVGDWVKVNKAANTSGGLFWVSPCMDCFDGAVVRISSFMFQEPSHFRADGVAGFVFSVDWIEPAVPPKIETANPSETPNSSTSKPGYFDDVEGVWVDEPNPFDGRKIEPVKEPEYREPTYADLANGPIEVEVCDNKTCDTNWHKKRLIAVLPKDRMFPFVVGSEDSGLTNSYRHARIKVR